MNTKVKPHLQFHRHPHTQLLQKNIQDIIRTVKMVACTLEQDKYHIYMFNIHTIRTCAEIKSRYKRFCMPSMSSFNYFHLKACKLHQVYHSISSS